MYDAQTQVVIHLLPNSVQKTSRWLNTKQKQTQKIVWTIVFIKECL